MDENGVKVSKKFKEMLEASREEKIDFPNLAEIAPSPLMRGITESRAKAALMFAKEVEYVEELIIIFNVLRKEGRLPKEIEEELMRMLGWKRSVIEQFVSNVEVARRISGGLGNLLDALAKRIAPEPETKSADNNSNERVKGGCKDAGAEG